jgi:arylsulfatase A-like enzyme
LIPWLEEHRNVPFFAHLHVQDPHDPFEPYPPYDNMWADPNYREQFEQHSKQVRKFISDPLMKAFGMPTDTELAAAKIDAEKYVDQEIGWYDGSIRALDAEVGRLLERLAELELEDKTLIAFVSDHGEEFLEHGRHFHGQSVYGELNRVPMILKGPGVAQGIRVSETVESIDLMPTILDLVGLDPPAEVQGQSLISLISSPAGQTATKSFRARPVFTEKAAIVQGAGPAPRDTAAYSVIDDGWKLVRHIAPPPGTPEKELFNHDADPLNLNDVAAANPELVERLTTLLENWKKFTKAHQLAADAEAAENMTQQEMEQLKSLGYL